MKDKPWQDIISLSAWDTLLENYEKGVMKSRAVSMGAKFGRLFGINYSLPPTLRNLDQQIRYYHDLEKPSVANLAKRAGMLRMIAATGKWFLQTYKVGSIQVVKNSMGEEQWKTYKSKHLDYAIAKLVRRSLRKADYIDKLKQHVDNADRGFITGKSTLLEYLKSQTKPLDDESLVSMHPDVLLEKIDPWHRHYEGKLTIYKNADAAFPIVFGVQAGGSVYGLAFMNWIRDTQYPEIPFFVWLEGHYVCTSLEDRSYQTLLDPQSGEMVYTIPKGSVSYQDAKSEQSAIKFLSASNGSVWSYKLDDEDVDVKLYDTQSVLSEGGDGPQGARMKGWHAEAFVWSRDGIIYAAEHRGGQFHHSSFLSGKKVRCSGMIEAMGGKIIKVSNDSGHYKPQTRHLKAFVQFLSMQNAFGPDAKVVDKSKDAKGVTPQAFLQAGGDQDAVRSEVERIMQVRKDWEKMNSKRTTLRELVEIRYQELRQKVGTQWPEYSLWKRAYKQICLEFATIDPVWKRRASAPPIPRSRAVRH